MDMEPGVFDALIAAGEHESEPVSLGPAERLHRIDMPAGWDAAPITLQAQSAEGVWRPIYTDAAEYVVSTAAPGRSIVLDQAVTFGISAVKVISGPSGAPVNQSADRLLKLVTAPL
jgi:hypothetical protein